VRSWLTVRGKLVLSSLVLLVVVSFAFTAASLYFSERLVEEDLRERAITFAREVAATIGDRGEFENPRLLHSEIRRIREARPNVRNIDFLALDGGEGWPRVLASSDAAWRPALTGGQVRDLRRGGVLARLVERPEDRHWEAVAPIVLDGAVVGAVAVEFSLVNVDRQLARVRRTSLAITGVSVLVAVALLGLVVRRVVHAPIRELLQVIGRVERGERDARAAATRRDEFGALASHFNGMLEQLARASAAQEERVRQATAELAERYAEVRRLNEGLFQAQRRLRHSDRLALLGRTLGMVAHEVGTPLHSIAGHLELLQQELPAPVLEGSAARRLSIVHSQLHRVTETIEQLLAAARRPAATRALLELDTVVREVLELIGPAVAAAGVRVDRERAPAPRIEGDGWQLQQALLNLVTNALDAMPGGGALGVRTGTERRDGREWAFVRITDTGAGISPDHLKRIFEPFFTTKEPGKGSGLGLFITEQVVRDHGGVIELDSAPEHGTSFTLAFPGVNGAP
jgi:two-component system NtrC family sensor kinase